MSESDSTQMREFLSLLTNTISFIGTETANLVRDKANRNVTGAEGINARAEEIDEAVTKLEAMSRYVALRVDDGTELSKRGRLAAKLPQGEQTKMTVAEQLTRAVLKARANKLTNTRAFVRCPNDVRLERLERELPLNDSIALRDLEMWITDCNGFIEGIIGDSTDGRENVILAMGDPSA